MNTVEFEEDDSTNSMYDFKSRKILGEPTTPRIITFLVRHKIVKNEAQGGKFVIILTLVVFAVSLFIYVYLYFGRPSEVKYISSPEYQRQLNNLNSR